MRLRVAYIEVKLYKEVAMAKLERDRLAEYELKEVKVINRTESRAGSYDMYVR